MMDDQWKERISMFLDNLSSYYVFSVWASIFTMLFTLWYCRQCQKEKFGKEKKGEKEIQDLIDDCDRESRDLSETDRDNVGPGVTLQSRIKVAGHKAIVNYLSSKMTPEQLVEEKQTEKAQLAAILNLLKEEQEKFNVSDMEELEQQLSLYR